ncbi:hypothetical protein [Vreelandella janggokensis]|uniref:hypothetical protein n=1 Tax=Vreelandella janggokensis TaxID=370767 RepID=UPI00286407B4|nr:hypothetical protein [Halomonas janggokensis]MDR5884772.1 hypothetical protein [Halomonas janggokensis]
MMLKMIKIVSLVALFALTGCASIPPEAPELSAELGKRISAIENSNITLLNRFFDQKRRGVDQFIENEWIPEFANQFFSNQTIADAWDTIVSENDKKQRLLFLVKTGPKLQKKINEKRLELIQPLDDLERRIEGRIREEYTQARAMNSSITSFLLSASKVTENRNRYLEMAGATDESLEELIDKTNDAVSDLLGQASDAQDKATRAEEFLGKVREIRNSI